MENTSRKSKNQLTFLRSPSVSSASPSAEPVPLSVLSPLFSSSLRSSSSDGYLLRSSLSVTSSAYGTLLRFSSAVSAASSTGSGDLSMPAKASTLSASAISASGASSVPVSGSASGEAAALTCAAGITTAELSSSPFYGFCAAGATTANFAV